jgi:hypothetical protein
MKHNTNVVPFHTPEFTTSSLDDLFKELTCVNRKLSHLINRKEEIFEVIINSLGHHHEGQKTYEYGVWKVEIKTPYTYSLNKKLYESGASKVPKKFNPIKHSTVYSVDKRKFEQYLEEAPTDIREMLIELVDKKPGKATVTIKERVS